MTNVEGDNKLVRTGRMPVAGEIARRLRQRIVKGIYRPHVYLPSERQLAQDFGTSRVTVAHALDALEREGLVSRSPGRGTRVLPILERLAQPKIGIVHGELPAMNSIRPDSLRTVQGARDTLDRLNYGYELVGVPGGQEQPLQTDFLEGFGAALLIESPDSQPSQIARLKERNAVVVVAKMEQELDVDVSVTWVDHREPMAHAVETFVGLGHRRIGFVARDPSFCFHGRAREGYLQGMRSAGLEIDESLIRVCEKTDALSAYLVTRSLLEMPQRPTALIAARDGIAEGICRAIQEAGLVVGYHVSVIGFDDLTWPEGREFLTTFREPCYEMGAAAAEMLVERIVNGAMLPEKRKFEAPFVLRRTAGPYFQSRP